MTLVKMCQILDQKQVREENPILYSHKTQLNSTNCTK